MRLAIAAGVQKLWNIVLDLFYPPRCVGCGQAGTFYCDACRLSVSRVLPPLCPLCGRPQDSAALCVGCASEPLQIDGIRSVALFSGALREAIHGLKYAYMRALVVPLGQMLVDFWQENAFPADILVPVPLHVRRVRERGYNQSRLLAQHLGRAVGVAVVCDVLCRNRYTVAQVHLGAEERRRNVADAFSCVGGDLEDKRVVLIDDVCTTGSTLEACSVALKAAGVRSVWAVTLARAA